MLINPAFKEKQLMFLSHINVLLIGFGDVFHCNQLLIIERLVYCGDEHEKGYVLCRILSTELNDKKLHNITRWTFFCSF